MKRLRCRDILARLVIAAIQLLFLLACATGMKPLVVNEFMAFVVAIISLAVSKFMAEVMVYGTTIMLVRKGK